MTQRGPGSLRGDAPRRQGGVRRARRRRAMFPPHDALYRLGAATVQGILSRLSYRASHKLGRAGGYSAALCMAAVVMPL
jgi:hypothetical protein